MLKNIGQMMKQAQEMQGRMQEMQEKLKEESQTGTAGGGLVSVTMNGKGDLQDVTIDPSLLSADEKEVLQDLLVAAHRDAKTKVDTFVQEKTQEMMGGLHLPPGFKMPF